MWKNELQEGANTKLFTRKMDHLQAKLTTKKSGIMIYEKSEAEGGGAGQKGAREKKVLLLLKERSLNTEHRGKSCVADN